MKCPRPREWGDGLSDEALLAGVAGGHDDAVLAFVRRFQGRVFGIALAVLRDHALAEDVAQEVFVRAWRNADAYDPRRGTVTAWLQRITRNLAIDTLRLRRPEPIDPESLAGRHLVAPGPATDDAVVVSDLTAWVVAALRQLPAEQSRALVLASFYGQTAQEISEAENIPLGTAKTRIRLGLRKVRGLLLDHVAPQEAEP